MAWQFGEPLCANHNDGQPYHIEDRLIHDREELIEGSAADFMRCLRSVLHKAWDETLLAVTDPKHHYYPVWECLEAAHDAHKSAYDRLRGFGTKDLCYRLTEENALVALNY